MVWDSLDVPPQTTGYCSAPDLSIPYKGPALLGTYHYNIISKLGEDPQGLLWILDSPETQGGTFSLHPQKGQCLWLSWYKSSLSIHPTISIRFRTQDGPPLPYRYKKPELD